MFAAEVAELLHPLQLDVLAWRDHQHPELGVEVPEQCHRTQRHVGLAHPDFVGEIGDVVLLQDVVDRDGSLELLIGATALADAGAEVE